MSKEGNGQALVRRADTIAPALYDGGRELAARDIVQQVAVIQEVMEAVMKDRVHYGTIPGCDKPSLYQAGAEKLLMLFKLAADMAVEDLSTEDEVRFRVTTTLTHIPTGNFVGRGVGECSSAEEKYAWRKAVCHAEYEYFEKRFGTKSVRTKFGMKKRGTYKPTEPDYYTVEQVRANAADVRNTILQMSTKRSVVAAAKRCTAASDFFTQSIEDLPEEYLQMAMEDDYSQEPAIQAPQRKSVPQPPQSTPEPEKPAPASNAPQQSASGNGTAGTSKLIEAFAALKVTPEMLAGYLGHAELEDSDIEELRKVYKILKAGELTWDELLQMRKEQEAIKNPLAESAPLEGEVVTDNDPVLDESQRRRMYAVMAKGRPSGMKASDWEKVGRAWIFNEYKIDSTAKVKVKWLDAIIAHFEALAAPESGEQA